MLDIMWCRAAVCTDVEAYILLDSALVGGQESTISGLVYSVSFICLSGVALVVMG